MSRQGFTLVEVVLILVIASLAILPLSMLFANTSVRSGDARSMTIAAQLAQAKMEEIAEEIRRRWGLDRVAMTHRVGRLRIGEPSVVIAVGTPHRKQAFEACEYAIDRLKAEVPIWKKEVGPDGEAWVE